MIPHAHLVVVCLFLVTIAVATEEICAMKKLLRITVSTRGAESFSLQLLNEFTSRFTAKHSNIEIVTRDVNNIPHIDYEALTAGRTKVEDQTPELKEAFELANTLTDEILDASHIVIASPMYNWGPPSALKAWIDRIINCRTYYDNNKPLSKTPITFIVVSGGPYSSDSGAGREKSDHFRPLLNDWFVAIGAQDMKFVNCDPTGIFLFLHIRILST